MVSSNGFLVIGLLGGGGVERGVGEGLGRGWGRASEGLAFHTPGPFEKTTLSSII